jgi:hypothetical protein
MQSSNKLQRQDSLPITPNRCPSAQGKAELRVADFGRSNFSKMSDGPDNRVGTKPVSWIRPK